MDDTNIQLKTLYENANKDVQAYLFTDELDEAVGLFGKVYKIPVNLYLMLKNTITLILLGAIQPDDAVDALQKNCNMSPSDAYSLAKDLNETVFQKIRLSILGKDSSEVKKLSVENESASKDELRKEILDTTKRPEVKSGESIDKSQEIQQGHLQPGSRSQLLEQLQIIGTIPDDDEVSERLTKIQGQIASIDSKKNERSLDTNIALKEFMFGEKGQSVVKAELGAATYSRAPTVYNVDPYREIGE